MRVLEDALQHFVACFYFSNSVHLGVTKKGEGYILRKSFYEKSFFFFGSFSASLAPKKGRKAKP